MTCDWPSGSRCLDSQVRPALKDRELFGSAMPRSKLNFFPLAFPFVLLLFLLVGLLIVFFEFGVIRYAYEKIGIDRRYVFALLALSLLGSYVNITIGELPEE
jgi:uncharacterized membrane protein